MWLQELQRWQIADGEGITDVAPGIAAREEE